MENGPFEDVSPIKNGGFPASYVSLPEGTLLHDNSRGAHPCRSTTYPLLKLLLHILDLLIVDTYFRLIAGFVCKTRLAR